MRTLAGALGSLLLLSALSGAPRAAAPAQVPLESFASSAAFFKAWKVKKWKGEVGTQFGADAAGPFLSLSADRSSWAFLRPLEADLAATPYLSWGWRVSAMPERGDGRRRETDDEAAQVYLFFPGEGLLTRVQPRILGYTWESQARRGTFYHSPKNDHTRVLVLRDRTDALGTWQVERRDVAADFRRAFGASPPAPLGLCLQIDADDTGARAESAFRDLRLEVGP